MGDICGLDFATALGVYRGSWSCQRYHAAGIHYRLPHRRRHSSLPCSPQRLACTVLDCRCRYRVSAFGAVCCAFLFLEAMSSDLRHDRQEQWSNLASNFPSTPPSSRCASSSTKSNSLCSCAIGCWSAATSCDVDDRIPHGFQDLCPTYLQEGHGTCGMIPSGVVAIIRVSTSVTISLSSFLSFSSELLSHFGFHGLPQLHRQGGRRSQPYDDGAKHAHPTDALSFGFPRYSYLLSRCK